MTTNTTNITSAGGSANAANAGGAGGSAIAGNGGNGAAGGVAWGGAIFNSGDTFSEDDGVFGGAGVGNLATGGDGGNAGNGGVVGTPGTGGLPFSRHSPPAPLRAVLAAPPTPAAAESAGPLPAAPSSIPALASTTIRPVTLIARPGRHPLQWRQRGYLQHRQCHRRARWLGQRRQRRQLSNRRSRLGRRHLQLGRQL